MHMNRILNNTYMSVCDGRTASPGTTTPLEIAPGTINLRITIHKTTTIDGYMVRYIF